MDLRIQSMRLANQESEQMIEVSNKIIRRKKLVEKITRIINKDG
jgi:hypothetical protein